MTEIAELLLQLAFPDVSSFIDITQNTAPKISDTFSSGKNHRALRNAKPPVNAKAD